LNLLGARIFCTTREEQRVARSLEAKKMRRELDKQLGKVAAIMGLPASWTAAEEAVLGLISDQIDRKVELSEAYQSAPDHKVAVKLSGEIRLLEASIARLLKQVEPVPPAPDSAKTVKARHAANARWRGEVG